MNRTLVITSLIISTLSSSATFATPSGKVGTPNVAKAETVTDDPPPSNKQLDELRKEIKDALATGKDYDIRVNCTADDQKCTPTAVYFSKPDVSFVGITKFATGKPLDIRITAGELAMDDKGEPRLPVWVQRHYDAAPDLIVVAVRKVGRKWVAGDSDTKTTINPVIDFGLFARAPELIVQLTSDNKPPVTIRVELRYQRWFVDMGGFLVFNTVVDQELITHSVDNKLFVDKKREKDSFTPATGAVLNLHPSSFPTLGFQFGLATNNNRQPSYFLGVAYRLRDLGPRALLTVAGGIAAVPTLRFPDVKVGDSRPSDDASLKGSTAYRFGPYLSLSFGFAFGDDSPAVTKSAPK